MSGESLLADRRRLAVAIAFVVIATMGVILCSRRFPVPEPGLVDDWYLATGPAQSVGDLLGKFFHATDRYRPSWDIVEYGKWHVLDGPRGTTGAEIWNVLRMLLIAAAITIVPGALISRREGDRDLSPIWIGLLAVIPGLILLAGPQTDVNFLHLGIQEAFAFGAVTCGLALVVWATSRVLAGERPTARGPALAYAFGYLLWFAGIFHKEASLAVVAIAPFLYLHLDREWRERQLLKGPLWRDRTARIAFVPLALTFLGAAFGVSRASGEGIEFYGAPKPHGIGGWIDRVADSVELQWNAMSGIAQTSEWHLLVVAAPLLAIAVFAVRRQVPWLAIGLIVAGWAVLIFQGVVLLPEPRYLIPGIALFGMALVLLLAELPAPVRATGLVLALALLVVKVGDVHTAVDDWVAIQTNDAKAVQAIADEDPARCATYFGWTTYETGESLPRLVRLERTDSPQPCDPRFAGIIAGLESVPGGPLAADDSVTRACADPGGPTTLVKTATLVGQPAWVISGCKSFRKKLDGRPVADILRQNRLIPGVGVLEVRKRCEAELGPEHCRPPIVGPKQFYASQ